MIKSFIISNLDTRSKHYKTHCPQGHEYTEENSYFVPSTGFRQCQTCRDEKNEVVKKNRIPKEPRTHCKRGHELTEENTYIQPKTGTKVCKTCQRMSNERRRERLKDDPNHLAYMRKHRAKWREENPDYHFNRELSLHFKMTPEDYQNLWDKQCGLCPICQHPLEDCARPNVDHDHSCCPDRHTCGKCVRGILCSDCNLGLGKFEDKVEILQRAIDYLKANKKGDL